MVDLIPLRKLYKYEELTREEGPDGRKYVYGDQRLPSVTTILSATKDKQGLDAWAARVGAENAERIKSDAAAVGTHSYEMGYRLINTYFQNMQEIWGSEAALYYPQKYAGTTDLVCVYRNKPCIMDFKQSVKPKKREWIDDYFHQLGAYALAHDIVHGTDIDYGVILMANQDGTTMEYSTAGSEFRQYKDDWLRRVERYYAIASAPVTGALPEA